MTLATILGAIVALGAAVLLLLAGVGYGGPSGDSDYGGTQDGNTVKYMALLRGATQSPVNASKGVGVALVELDLESGELTYSVNFRDLTGEATTGLHIHRAKPGLNGPIIYDLGFYGGALSFNFQSPVRGLLPFDLGKHKADLDGGLLYVNLHSDLFIGGELRGQLRPVTYVASLDGASELPPTGSTGKGWLYMSANDETGSSIFSVSFESLIGRTTTGLHIHSGPAGGTGPIVYDLGEMAGVPTTGFESPVAGIVWINPLDLLGLGSGEFFVNLHSGMFPLGEIRGQIAAFDPPGE